MGKEKTKNPCFVGTLNKATKSFDILLHDEIGFWGDDSKTFNKMLSENKDRVINVDINSPGGEVFDGFSMYNALIKHEAPVNITISGVVPTSARLKFFKRSALST